MKSVARGPGAPPALPPAHPAMLVAALAAAALVLLSVSFAIFDPDLFQHLLVGKVIWQTHGVPQQHLWTWPSYGTPEVLPSWLFRALVWPFWSVAGVEGLFAWRWLTTLAAFGLMWATARRLGARGFTPLVTIALCALIYRQRSMVRPETLVAVLLALELWILETRRQGGPDRTPWLVAIACLWANAHISYYLGLMVLGLFWAESWLAGRSARARRSKPGAATGARPDRRLGVILLASAAVSFLNPFGWRALWQPFEYFLYWRHEPIFQIIGELRGIDWPSAFWGLPLLAVGWPASIVWRALRGRRDLVEAGLCLAFTGTILLGQRFVGFYALVASAYAGRGLSEWLGALGVAERVPLWGRVVVASLACLVIGIPVWTSASMSTGIRLLPLWYPERACDFIADRGIRGRGFTHFDLAGYQLFRFWPDRARLPFMDIHQTGARADRDAYARLMADPSAWSPLDGRHRFDYALLSRRNIQGNGSLDALDADSAFALVFVDDVAALYARRQGETAGVAAELGFRWLPAGTARVAALQRMCETDSAGCAALESEIRRAIGSSPRNAQARSLLANVAMAGGRYGEARALLERALAVDPNLKRGHERLGMLDLEEGRPREALVEFRAELRQNGAQRGLDLRMGHAYRRLGNFAAAARHYRRELSRDPGFQEAADSLAALPR